MIKKQKIWIAIVSALLVTSTIAIGVTIPILQNTQSNHIIKPPKLMTSRDWEQGKAFSFNNKNYLSLSDAFDDLIQDIDGIKMEQFVGNLTKVEPNGLVDIANPDFKKYDISKLLPAYQDANGRYTSNYDKAIDSFINIASLVSMYYDFKGNYFLDENDAKNNMNAFSSMGVTYYEVQDMEGKKHRINPLNPDDQLRLKAIAIEFLQSQNKNNIINNPFNLIAIKQNTTNFKNTNNEIYEQQNILDENMFQSEPSEFVKEVFKLLNEKILKIIYGYLTNHDVIKTRIYIKPNALDFNSTSIYSRPAYYEDINWYFNNITNKKYIDSEPVNLADYNQIFDIFSNLDSFRNHFDIQRDRNDSWGTFRPWYENAILKNDETFIKDVFKNDVPRSIKKQKINIPPNTLRDANEKTISRILRKSDNYDNWWDKGPQYYSNNTLAFGISPYMEAKARQDLKKWVIDEILKVQINGSTILADTINKAVEAFLKSSKTESIDYAIYLKAFSTNPYDYVKSYDNNDNLIRIDDFFVKEKNNFANTKVNASLVSNEIKKRTTSGLVQGMKNAPYMNQDVINKLNLKPFCDENNYLNMINTPDYLYMDWASSRQLSIYQQGDNDHDMVWNRANATLGFFEIGDKTKKQEDVVNNFIGLNSEQFISKINKKHEINKNSIINYEYFITYNDLPLYRLNEDVVFANDSLVNFTNLNLPDLFTDIYNHNQNILAINQININSKNHLELLKKLFINVSSEIKFDNNISQTYFENYQFIKNEPRQDRNIAIVNNEKLLIPNDKNMPTVAYLPQDSTYDQLLQGPKNIVDIYNNSLEHIQSSSSLGNELILNTRKINQKTLQEAVVLYEKVADQPTYYFQKLEYAETPEGATNFNLSLSNPENESVVATTGKEMKNIKARLSVFNTPVKIYFVYSNSNLINIPGSSSLNQSIIPDYIDSPELVLQNAKHTYYLPPNNNYVMYQTSLTNEIVLKNSLFNLFSITLNNQFYYFNSANQAQNELINYIKMNAYQLF